MNKVLKDICRKIDKVTYKRKLVIPIATLTWDGVEIPVYISKEDHKAIARGELYKYLADSITGEGEIYGRKKETNNDI